jgi:hypothetical protein
MKSNDFKVGNNFIDECEIKKITPRHIDFLWINERKSVPQVLLWIKPIRITHDIMLNLGFLKDEYFKNRYLISDKYSGNRYSILNYGNEWDWQFGDITFAQMKYVHEIQNLFLIVMKEELKLDIPNLMKTAWNWWHDLPYSRYDKKDKNTYAHFCDSFDFGKDNLDNLTEEQVFEIYIKLKILSIEK